MWNYDFKVPSQKQIRMIVHTDCKNEADDQYALAHHLMTPKFEVRGIIAGHFEKNVQQYGKKKTMEASYKEINKVLELMDVAGDYPVFKGAAEPLPDECTPIPSPGADFIIQEAKRDDQRPLYIGLQGCLTDLAAALLIDPSIADKLTAIWIGGGTWPEGGSEFNLWQDIHAANVVMESNVNLWQVPKNVYKQVAVSLAELQYKVKPCGAIGKYLFEQMVDFNTRTGDISHWPHGEIWGLGDQPTVSLLLEEQERDNYDWKHAPRIGEDMTYIHNHNNRKIRVYHTVDARLTMEDFYAKLAINFPPK